MIYVTSDLHGYPLELFKKLLDKSGFTDDDFLYVLGDVVDRGEAGVELLLWLMAQPNVELILGNHEAMLLSCDFIFNEITDESINGLNPKRISLLSTWMTNGAAPTLRDLKKLKDENPENLNDLLDFLREIPLYDAVTIGDRDFLLVHSGLGNFSKDKKMKDYSANELVWTRPNTDDRYFDNITTILGHTPTSFYGEEFKGKIYKTPTWIDVDTGVACGEAPCLLRLDDMQEFYF